ncbi:MAG: SLBB domain-containing protein, partial [Gemmatimonadota bacterium]
MRRLHVRIARPPRGSALLVFAALFMLAASARQASAQQMPSPAELQQLIQQNPGLVRQQLMQSGLSEREIRAQLGAAGLPANALDQFLGTGMVEPGAAGASSADVLRAMQALGLQIDPDGVTDIPLTTGFQIRDPFYAPEDSAALPIFGLSQFRRATSQFQPLLAGPVPSDYRIGPGDRMILVLTGDVQLAHELEVTREGFVVIPNVGQISVANLTMDGLRSLLRQRLASSYSGIERGTTTFDLTVSQLRTNQIYVIGEVRQPGAYQLASVATVMNALYAADGPTNLGSLRQVQLRRRNGETVTLDLYDYLLEGDASQDEILQQGDIVFVPLRERQVSLVGAVSRPAIYEPAPDEGLLDMLRAAGGFAPEARRSRITIHRVLEPGERGPGITDRAAVDLALPSSDDPSNPRYVGGVIVPPVGLQHGDSVHVDGVAALEDAYYVTVRGRVQSPGRFPWRPGMTLRDLVELARGPAVGADLREAEIARLPDDRDAGELAELMRMPLDSSYLDIGEGAAFQGPRGVPFPPPGTAPVVELEPFDQVTVLLQPDFQLQRDVAITGEVPVPGRYTLRSKDDRLADLVARAGGLLPTAYPMGAQLHRAERDLGRVDVELLTAIVDPASSDNIALEPGDSLHIPVYSPTVVVEGAVNSPATVLYREGQGLDYYIESAGGFRNDADEGRTAVRFANGRAQLRDKFLFWSSYPTPGPGSIVTVPTENPDDRFNWRGLVTDLVAITGS